MNMKKIIKKTLYNIFSGLCEIFTDWTEEGFEPTFFGWIFYKLKQKCS